MPSALLLHVVIVVAIVTATTVGWAAPLTISGDVPCSRGELAAALRLRVGEVAVVVHGHGDRVRVEVGDQARVIDLEGTRGRMAARRIALAAAEIALPELPAGAPVVHAPRPPLARLAVTARIASETAPRAAIVVGAEIGRRSPRLAIDAGLAAGGGERDVVLVGVPVRAGLSFGEDLRIRIAGIALPFRVEGGLGDTGVLAGGGLEAHGRTRVGGAGGVDVVYLFGFDVFANQIEYRWGAESVFTTPRVELWMGAGVSWEAGW